VRQMFNSHFVSLPSIPNSTPGRPYSQTCDGGSQATLIQINHVLTGHFSLPRPQKSALARSSTALVPNGSYHARPLDDEQRADNVSKETTLCHCKTGLSLDQPNEKLVALLFAVEALRCNGAKRLVLVAPYLCYMRQDIVFSRGGNQQKAIGGLLAGLVDRVITVDAHLHRTADIHEVFPGIEADNLSAMPVIADALHAVGLDSQTVTF
jgi:hypothetical protein